MRFLPAACFAAVVGTAGAFSAGEQTIAFKPCTCTDLLNGATEDDAALCEKFANSLCRPLNDDAKVTDVNGGCPIDSFRCDPRKSAPKKVAPKIPPKIAPKIVDHAPDQCPPIKPQNTLDTIATSGEWFVQQASTTAFFDAVVDKCYTQYYLFDLDVDEDDKTRDVFFDSYAEKKTLPPAAVLEAIKAYHFSYDDDRRKLSYASKWDSEDNVQWVHDAMLSSSGSGYARSGFWEEVFHKLQYGHIGNFTMVNGEVVRTDPFGQFPGVIDQIEKGFVDLAICGNFKVTSDFESILPCAAPAASRLAPPDQAKWFFVFAGSIDKATGHLVEGLVGDDLMYEYAIVSGGAQVPLQNGKCAPGAGFINGGYQLLSRFPTGEQKAIELLRQFTEANTNIDVHTLLTVKQAGCTYSNSRFKGQWPLQTSVRKFAQTLASGKMDFACPPVKPLLRPFQLPDGLISILSGKGTKVLKLGSGIPEIGGCLFVVLSTPFAGLNPSTDKCAQQGYYFRPKLGETFSQAIMPPSGWSRRKLDGLEALPLFVELVNINNKTSVNEVTVKGDGFSLCGDVDSEEFKFRLGACFPDQTENSKPPGVLNSNWFVLFFGAFVPAHVTDGGHFVPARLVNFLDLPLAVFTRELIVIATGGQPMTPTPDGCAAGTGFIDSGLVVETNNPDGIPPAAVEAIYEFLKEQHFDTTNLMPVKQGVKNGCPISRSSGKQKCYLRSPNSALFDEEPPCFPSSATVQRLSTDGVVAPVKMEHLQVGDRVLTASGFSEVFAFMDHTSKPETEYLKMTTASGATLKLSAQHIIFAHAEKEPVMAAEVKVGDLLWVANNDAVGEGAPLLEPSVVLEIAIEIAKGLHAPLTLEGSLVVDSVLASSYAASQTLRWGKTPLISGHRLGELLHAPLRFACGVAPSLCGPEWHTAELGRHMWTQGVLDRLGWLQKLNLDKSDLQAELNSLSGSGWFAASAQVVATLVLVVLDGAVFSFSPTTLLAAISLLWINRMRKA